MVEMRTKDACGFDVSAVNLHRWHPAYAAGRPLAKVSAISRWVTLRARWVTLRARWVTRCYSARW